MTKRRCTIWSNVKLPPPPLERLKHGIGECTLVQPSDSTANNLAPAGQDPQLARADIAFGQPDPDQIMQLPRLRWVQLTTAGYTRYDTPQFRDAVKRNGTIICNASTVYADPCAQHLLAMMLSLARRIPHARDNQLGSHAWPYLSLRAQSKLLNGQTVFLIGYGAISRRLSELLAPLDMNLIGFRRHPSGDEGRVRIVSIRDVDQWLPQADHVVNILPASNETAGFFNAARFALMKRTAVYYNIGRGTTNDESALAAALRAGNFAEAYIDAFETEPLPPDHFLWTTPNCFITPHTGGGHSNEYDRHVELFLENLKRFQAGRELIDRIM